MSHPLVSICVPNLNKRPFLEARMETLLGQTLTDWELVVCDSQSDDGSWEFLQTFRGDRRIQLHQVPREGLYAGWNECLRRARGQYLHIATSDDTAAPDQLERLAALLDRHPAAGIALGAFDYIDAEGRVLPRRRHRLGEVLGEWESVAHIRSGRTEFLLHCAFDTAWVTLNRMLVRRAVLDRTGPFPTDLGRWGDLSWSLRAALAAGDIAYDPAARAGWRQYEGQATSHGWDSSSRWLLLRDLDRLLADPGSGVPAPWREQPGWRATLRRYRLAAWRESLGLRRATFREAPSRFLAGMATALHHDPVYLARRALHLFGAGEDLAPEGPSVAHDLIRAFRAPWPPASP